MAKRLTEDDIRRIFREETEAQRKYDELMATVTDEAREVHRRLSRKELVYAPGAEGVLDYDWDHMVQIIIDTYWEVVEEETNANH